MSVGKEMVVLAKVVRIFTEKRIPRIDVGEAEEEILGEEVRSLAAVEGEYMPAAVAIEAGCADIEIFIELVHSAKILN